MGGCRGRPLSGWRRLAAASWGPPADPQFFGSLDVDAAALLSFATEVREQQNVHVSMTHLVGRAVVHGLQTVPALRQRLAHGRAYERESLDLFFIITTSGGGELTGVKIDSADTKSAVQIAIELEQRRHELDAGLDETFGRTKALMQLMPRPVLRQAMRLSAWLTSDLNVDLPRFGLPRQAFGAAMVTSVGMWSVSSAYSPLAAYYRVPVLVLVGTVESRAVARAGSVVARPMMTITATFDHRYVDGFQAAQFGAAIREYCAHPERFEPSPV
jgi:pyruvate dehydrogenase E2 component (dihydrolipoamide acetyltransferase)